MVTLLAAYRQLAAIREGERGHLRRVTRLLGAVEGLAVHLFQVVQDAFTGARHTEGLEGFEGQAGREIINRLDTFFRIEELRQALEHIALAAIGKVHRRRGVTAR